MIKKIFHVISVAIFIVSILTTVLFGNIVRAASVTSCTVTTGQSYTVEVGKTIPVTISGLASWSDGDPGGTGSVTASSTDTSIFTNSPPAAAVLSGSTDISLDTDITGVAVGTASLDTFYRARRSDGSLPTCVAIPGVNTVTVTAPSAPPVVVGVGGLLVGPITPNPADATINVSGGATGAIVQETFDHICPDMSHALVQRVPYTIAPQGTWLLPDGSTATYTLTETQAGVSNDGCPGSAGAKPYKYSFTFNASTAALPNGPNNIVVSAVSGFDGSTINRTKSFNVFHPVCSATGNPPSQTVALTNTGASTLTWTASGDQSWFSVSPTSGSLAAGASANITASANKVLVPGAGTYTGTITVSGNAPSQTVPVTFTVTP